MPREFIVRDNIIIIGKRLEYDMKINISRFNVLFILYYQKYAYIK